MVAAVVPLDRAAVLPVFVAVRSTRPVDEMPLHSVASAMRMVATELYVRVMVLPATKPVDMYPERTVVDVVFDALPFCASTV